MIPDNLDTIVEDEKPLNQDTQRYLLHIENKLYQDIEMRKRVDSGLLFIACQISGCSLAWILFQLQVTLSIIQVSSACINLLPGLISVGDGFSFSVNSQSWEFSFGEKPLAGVIKLLVGGAISLSGTSKITSEVIQTQSAISATYAEIRNSKGLTVQLPNISISLLLALFAVVLIGVVKKLGTSSNEEI